MVRVVLLLAVAVTYIRPLDSRLGDGIKAIEEGTVKERRDVTRGDTISVGLNSAANKAGSTISLIPSSATSSITTAFRIAPVSSTLTNWVTWNSQSAKKGWPFEAVTFNHPIQSPVDLITFKAVTKDLPMLDIIEHHLDGVQAKVYNSGHTVYVYVKEDASLRPYLIGGPLPEKFTLEQMHFHWGSEDIWGSEHFVDGESFAVEIHLVHYNSKYKSFEEAAAKKDGLAVLTIFAEVSATDNPLLEPLHKLLPKISEAKSSAMMDALQAMQWPASALSTNSEYYCYPGSLTTEPYSENVVFILLPKPITMSMSQLSSFRSLHSEEHGYITDNKRKLQPLHNRPIVRSTKLQ